MLRAFDRLLMRYLRRRGWIVFWLDEHVRCGSGICWLDIYRDERKGEVPPLFTVTRGWAARTAEYRKRLERGDYD
jgi:hypothetical protein